MMSIIEALLAFIVVIGILVTVHEFGHYWVARRLGVKILRFSIGFGWPLWKKSFGKDNTEFVIAAIPLGGYVKMLDEHEGEVAPEDLPRAFNRQSLKVLDEHEGEVAPEDLPRAFNRQSLKVRTAIVVAGPLFNFLFAIVAYAAMFMVGVTGMKALVGEVTPQSLAEQAGFRPGDQIIAVNQQPTVRWESVIQLTMQHKLDDKTELVYSVQNQHGLKSDLSLNIQAFTIDDIAKGQLFDKLGMRPFRPPLPAIVGEIKPESAAEKAGLQHGDKIIALDNQPISDWSAWAMYVSQRPGQAISAEIERNHQRLKLTLKPSNEDGKGRMGVYAQGYTIPDEYLDTERYNVGSALIQGMVKTWDISVLTLRVMAKMLTLQISYKHISGPITIAEFAGKTAQMGLSVFLSFLGLVSVSLGVINLLPIPLLDGGHLFFYLIEGIKGNPVTEKTEYLLQRIGLVLLFSLMGLAIFNDLGRIFS